MFRCRTGAKVAAETVHQRGVPNQKPSALLPRGKLLHRDHALAAAVRQAADSGLPGYQRRGDATTVPELDRDSRS
jgi:hypothetical protein